MGSTKYQYCVAIIVNLMTMTFGIACGWVSPYLPYLSSNETPLDAKLTVEQASLIAALISGGGLFGNIILAWMSNKFGRKYPLMFIAIPQIVGWVLILYAKNAYHLYAARFLLGLVGGGIFVVVPVTISEIAEDRIRGVLGSFLVLGATLGTLLEFIFGEYCSYSLTPIVVLATTFVFLGGMSFFPETPAVLYKTNRIKEAEESICFYRQFDRDSKTDMEILQVEMDKLELSLAKSTKEESGLSLADFMTPAARKAMLIGLMLAGTNQLCGCFAMINYTATIFRESGSTLTPNGSAIVVGCLQVCGAYASTVLVDRAGRKFLLALSAAATSFGLAGLGAYLYLKSVGCAVEEFGWIPIACFSFGVFFAHWGVLTLPFLVISEILPVKIKNAGSAICMAFLSTIAFFMVKFFPMLSDALGMHGSMFLFATFSMIGAIFVMTVMPETKGKSFDEIMKLLER